MYTSRTSSEPALNSNSGDAEMKQTVEVDRLLSGHPPGGHGDGRGLFNPPIPPQQRVGPRTWRFAAWCGATGMNTSTTY